MVNVHAEKAPGWTSSRLSSFSRIAAARGSFRERHMLMRTRWEFCERSGLRGRSTKSHSRDHPGCVHGARQVGRQGDSAAEAAADEADEDRPDRLRLPPARQRARRSAPALEVPIATPSGQPQPGSPAFCELFGFTTPFTDDQMRSSYPTQSAYLSVGLHQEPRPRHGCRIRPPVDRAQLLAKAKLVEIP